MTDKTAVVVVDAQRDFINGALPVPGAVLAVGYMEEVLKWAKKKKVPVFLTVDDHPENHCSFKENGGTWPTHCVVGSDGNEIHPLILQAVDRERSWIVPKGTEAGLEAYSGFSGTALEAMLKDAGITRLVICGLATDYCVHDTVMDALAFGFEVVVPLEAIAGVREEETELALNAMEEHGAILVPYTKDLPFVG